VNGAHARELVRNTARSQATRKKQEKMKKKRIRRKGGKRSFVTGEKSRYVCQERWERGGCGGNKRQENKEPAGMGKEKRLSLTDLTRNIEKKNKTKALQRGVEKTVA